MGITKERVISWTACTAVIWLAVMLIYSSESVSAAVSSSVSVCLNVIIPSLFAFTVISSLLISSDIYRLAGLPFGALSRYIFRLPEELFPVFIISQLAGYPVGATLISALAEQDRIDRRQAGSLLRCCIAPGPAFIAGTAALICPGVSGAALCLFISVTGANLLILLLSAPFRDIPAKRRDKVRISFSAEDMTLSVSKGSASMLMICGMIVFMSALTACLESSGILTAFSSALSAVLPLDMGESDTLVRSALEISCVRMFRGVYDLPVCAALLSFGGICVHMQIGAVCGKKVPMKSVILFRIAAAALSYILCRITLRHFIEMDVVSVFAHGEAGEISTVAYSNNAPLCSVFLLIMTILLLSQKSIVKTKKM